MKSVKISKLVKSKVSSNFYFSVLLRWVFFFFFFAFEDWTEHQGECQVLVLALKSKQSGPSVASGT